MAERKPSDGRPPELRFQLLRYSPRPENGEFYNVGAVFYDAENRPLDARFTPDYTRMRCNPAVNFQMLDELRNELEEARLLGEDFSGYLAQLIDRRQQAVEATELKTVYCKDVTAEIDRIVERYLATPPGLEDSADAVARQGSRSAVRRRMTEVFALHGLFRNGHGMQRDVGVEYGPSGLKFAFDFQYRAPESEEQFVQALGLRSPDAEAARLCFVLQQYREKSRTEAGLTVVADDMLGDDVRNLLSDRGVGAVNLSAVDTYAASIRQKLGL